MGYAAPRQMPLQYYGPYLDHKMREINAVKKPDIMLVGCQAGTIPYDIVNHNAPIILPRKVGPWPKRLRRPGSGASAIAPDPLHDGPSLAGCAFVAEHCALLSERTQGVYLNRNEARWGVQSVPQAQARP